MASSGKEKVPYAGRGWGWGTPEPDICSGRRKMPPSHPWPGSLGNPWSCPGTSRVRRLLLGPPHPALPRGSNLHTLTGFHACVVGSITKRAPRTFSEPGGCTLEAAAGPSAISALPLHRREHASPFGVSFPGLSCLWNVTTPVRIPKQPVVNLTSLWSTGHTRKLSAFPPFICSSLRLENSPLWIH